MRYQGARSKRSPGPKDARDMIGRATARLCEVGVEAVRTVARPPPEAYRPGSIGQDKCKRARTNLAITAWGWSS